MRRWYACHFRFRLVRCVFLRAAVTCHFINWHRGVCFMFYILRACGRYWSGFGSRPAAAGMLLLCRPLQEHRLPPSATDYPSPPPPPLPSHNTLQTKACMCQTKHEAEPLSLVTTRTWSNIEFLCLWGKKKNPVLVQRSAVQCSQYLYFYQFIGWLYFTNLIRSPGEKIQAALILFSSPALSWFKMGAQC